MREIKFRAWDEGKAIYPNLVGRYGDYFTVWCPDGSYANTQDLEQFTGLYDKNGKEIYEGDILENPDHEEAFYVEYHEGVSGYVGWGDDKTAGCYLITGDDIEVIGNIHENPELLQEVSE